MSKDKTIRTNQGKLEIWEHEAGSHEVSGEQKYGSRIFNKETCGNVLKIHSCAKALEAYITGLNIILPDK